MVKRILPAISLVLFLGSCSALKQIDVSSDKPVTPVAAYASAKDRAVLSDEHVKFLNNISSEPARPEMPVSSTKRAKGPNREVPANEFISSSSEKNVSASSALQIKYAGMMNIDPAKIKNLDLYGFIDDWYGTPYKLGGSTKKGIDCSAFVQFLFASVYGITLPRTSKYQYTSTKRISTTQLKEGDLLFFHTRRNFKGVTHVGVYLQNNKFVQASSSGGVTISDMYDPYYVKHLVGAGRAVADN
ncbi:MAG: C40 family peptidase [Chitinophagales bacterium]|nr:C40 family peptidase [Chitinophagales bacterium]